MFPKKPEYAFLPVLLRPCDAQTQSKAGEFRYSGNTASLPGIQKGTDHQTLTYNKKNQLMKKFLKNGDFKHTHFYELTYRTEKAFDFIAEKMGE